jgi:CheY-like chemotaxis protein
MSAGEAIDALSEFTPDLVLSDIAMPARMSTRFRARCARAIAAGFDEYVAKPADPAALAFAVARLAAVNNR